jgi:hypothetical protein
MNPTANTIDRNANFELRFQSLFDEGRGLAFPCDAAGQVDMDALTEQARNNYFCARALIGRDFRPPTLRATVRH